MIRVVLDTNVLINADRGEFSYGKRLLELVRQGKLTAVTTSAVRRENELLVGRLVNDQRLARELKVFFGLAQQIQSAKVTVTIEDEEDIKLLAAAVGGGAQFLITSDRHLLELGEYQGVRVVRPAEFWQWWQVHQDEAGETWSSWARGIFGQ